MGEVGSGGLESRYGAPPCCCGTVWAAGVGSSTAAEHLEAPKTPEDPWWVGLGRGRHVLPLFLARRREALKFLTRLGWE